MVVFLFMNTQLNAQTSTPVPANAYQNPLRGFMQFMFPGQPETVPQSQIPTAIPGTGTPTYPYPSITPGSVLTGTPAPIPAGECTAGLNRALSNLDAVASQVIPVYQQAGSQTGLPWEILAAIHYVETGGSFDPNRSLISGRPLGTPEPDQGNKIYTTLLESAIDAASVFKSKYGSTSGPFNDFQRLVRAFALYNGPGNRQCTDTGIVKPQSRYIGCPRLFDYEDHLYPLACYDSRHENMWYIYCSDGQVCPPISATNPGVKYSPSKVGTLTLIAGIQARSQPTPTVPPGTPTPPGLPGNPAYGRDIVQEVRSVYTTLVGPPASCSSGQCISVTRGNADRILNAVTRAGEQFKLQVRRSVNVPNQYVLQCVGGAFALSAELNGVIPQIGHIAACQFTDTTSAHQFYRYGDPGVAPLPGDLVVWNSSGGQCNPTSGHYGHIAYIVSIADAHNISVAEANWGRPGDLNVRTKDLTTYMPVGFLRKK